MIPVNSPPARKRIRLDASVYGELGTRVLVTCTVNRRRPVFANWAFALEIIELLREQSSRHRIAVLAYCVMPDHLHILSRVDGDTDIVRFMQAFKGKTTNSGWRYGLSGRLWQRSFYDHILRESEDEAEFIRYILWNPVRAGLTETWSDYPFCGSFAYDLTGGL